MVVIRLSRGGSKKSPYYHIVAADKRYSRDGRYIERLGYYNPLARGQEAELRLLKERVDHWMKQGAQPSDRVKHLLASFATTASDEAVTRPTRAETKKMQQENAEKAAFEARKKAETEAKAAAAAEKQAAEAADKAASTEEKPADSEQQ